jgi:hypothetical protein
MTDSNNTNHSPDAVEQAMNTVLQAERTAEQAIADCKAEAQRTVLAAQEQAQQIAARTDKRLALCHRRCNTRVSREIKARQRAEEADHEEQPWHKTEETGLATVVETVARDLIGGSRTDGEDGVGAE